MDLIVWIAAHGSDVVKILGETVTLASLVVALLPQSASKNAIVALLERISVLTHKDSPGTLKMPGTSAVAQPSSSGDPQ